MLSDVIIIGAGPAGLAAATTLARQGAAVLVLERKDRIGPKVCAGGIPPHALRHMNLPEDLWERTFPQQTIVTPRQKACIRDKQSIITTIDREKLGQFMLRKAIAAGAKFHTGSYVESISEGEISYSFSTPTGRKRQRLPYHFLIGADGSSSLVRRFLKIPTQRMGSGIQHNVAQSLPNMEWHFNPARFKSGYAWIFPHKERTSVGIYAERDHLPPRKLKDALKFWAGQQNISLEESKPEAALINFDYRGWNFGNIFLTGDAAGLASGLTGEGIVPAILSGHAAAHEILTPGVAHPELKRVLKQQDRHCRMQHLLARQKVICQTVLEVLVLALRLRLLPIRHIEMS